MNINNVLLKIIQTWDKDKCFFVQFAEKFNKIPTIEQYNLLLENCKCEACKREENERTK